MHTWEILGLPVYQYCPRFPVWNSTKCWGLDLKFHIFITQSTRIEDNTRVLLPFLDYIFVLYRTSKFWFCSTGSRTISSYWYLWFQKSSNTGKQERLEWCLAKFSVSYLIWSKLKLLKRPASKTIAEVNGTRAELSWVLYISWFQLFSRLHLKLSR